MKYIYVHWTHDHADEPIDLYSENDDGAWEVRKVEVYADGRADYADAEHETGSTFLAEVPMPSVEAIAANPADRPS